MSRRVVVVFAGLSLALGVAGPSTTRGAAAPVPKHLMKPLPAYHPTQLGTKWVYARGDHEQTWMIAKVEAKENEKIVVIEEMLKEGNRHHQTIAVRPNGLFLVAEDKHTYQPPWCILKLPHKADATWETTSSWDKSSTLAGTMQAFAEERVKVPAGEFTAIRVEWAFWLSEPKGKPHTATYWYAPNVGLVQMDDPPSLMLKSFTPGK